MKKPTVVAVYSNKGGVGKTTTCMELAICLQRDQHCKVLLVDADPSCSLTHFLMGFDPAEQVATCILSSEGSHPHAAATWNVDVEDLHPFATGVIPANGAERAAKRTVEGVLASQTTVYDFINHRMYMESLPPAVTMVCGGVFFIPGSPKLAKIDKWLNKLSGASLARAHEITLFEDVVSVLREVGRMYDTDYVLLDLASTENMLTQAFVMMSDLVLPLGVPDAFGVDSLRHMMFHTLPKWYNFSRNKLCISHRPVLLPLITAKVIFDPATGAVDKRQILYIREFDHIMNHIDRYLMSPTCSCNGQMALPLLIGRSENISCARAPLSLYAECLVDDGVEKTIVTHYASIAKVITAAREKLAFQTTTPARKTHHEHETRYAPPTPKKPRRCPIFVNDDA